MASDPSHPSPVAPSENADAGAVSDDGALAKTKGRAELDQVTITRPVKANFQPGEDGFATNREIPAGASGTIVAVWDHGEAYEVEFTKPFAAIATVEAADLTAACPDIAAALSKTASEVVQYDEVPPFYGIDGDPGHLAAHAEPTLKQPTETSQLNPTAIHRKLQP